MAPSVVPDDPVGMRRTESRVRALLRSLAGPTYPLPAPCARLVDCPVCGQDLVNPVRWHERDATHWSIRLRCGGCGHLREAHATDEEAKCFERDLERGAEQIAATVAMSERESMRAAAATLEAALEHDLIDPGDFCR